MKKTIVICGETATGKTEHAVVLGKYFDTAVISADSQLIYKGLNIGTAKPTLAEMENIQHYMIDIIEPNLSFSVAEYTTMAEPIIANIEAQEKPPILCGGTGFYIQSLLFKRSLGTVGRDNQFRKYYQELAKLKGNTYLFEELKKVDVQTAEKLHVNDVNRVIRALEIYALTGKKKSEQVEGFSPKREYIAIAFDYDRDTLYTKINQRVRNMLKLGWIDEVQQLLKQGVMPDMQSMQAIGYKEVISYLSNCIGYNEMLELIQRKTRNYAKRQITFFKKFPNLTWISPNTNIVKKVKELL